MTDAKGTQTLIRYDGDEKGGQDNDGFHSSEKSADSCENYRDNVVVDDTSSHPSSPLDSNDGAHHVPNGHATVDDVRVSIGEELVNNCSSVVETTSDAGSCDTVILGRSNGQSSPALSVEEGIRHLIRPDDVRTYGNGDTQITIPEDAIINFNSGRVRVKKNSPRSKRTVDQKEKIPMENMTDSGKSFDNGDHNHGQNGGGGTIMAITNPRHNEKLITQSNGTGKGFEEYFIPVNTHKKFLRGEKLYLTKDDRKLCEGWRRIIICGLITIVIAVAVLVGVLAATGILLAESETKTTRHEPTSHMLPDRASIMQIGNSKKHQPSSNVPPKVLPPAIVVSSSSIAPPVAETTNKVVNEVTSQVSHKVPALQEDTSHSHTIVPNALLGEFKITDENFTEDLKDNTSYGYLSLATHLESELKRIIEQNGGICETLKVINIRPGSIIVKFVAIWMNERDIIPAKYASEIMASYMMKHSNMFLAFQVDPFSFKFSDVVDECRLQNGGCSYNCMWSYSTLSKTCTCPESMVLSTDKKTCDIYTPKSTIPSEVSAELSSPSITEDTYGMQTEITVFMESETDISPTTEITTLPFEESETVSVTREIATQKFNSSHYPKPTTAVVVLPSESVDESVHSSTVTIKPTTEDTSSPPTEENFVTTAVQTTTTTILNVTSDTMSKADVEIVTQNLDTLSSFMNTTTSNITESTILNEINDLLTIGSEATLITQEITTTSTLDTLSSNVKFPLNSEEAFIPTTFSPKLVPETREYETVKKKKTTDPSNFPDENLTSNGEEINTLISNVEIITEIPIFTFINLTTGLPFFTYENELSSPITIEDIYDHLTTPSAQHSQNLSTEEATEVPYSKIPKSMENVNKTPEVRSLDNFTEVFSKIPETSILIDTRPTAINPLPIINETVSKFTDITDIPQITNAQVSENIVNVSLQLTSSDIQSETTPISILKTDNISAFLNKVTDGFSDSGISHLSTYAYETTAKDETTEYFGSELFNTTLAFTELGSSHIPNEDINTIATNPSNVTIGATSFSFEASSTTVDGAELWNFTMQVATTQNNTDFGTTDTDLLRVTAPSTISEEMVTGLSSDVNLLNTLLNNSTTSDLPVESLGETTSMPFDSTGSNMSVYLEVGENDASTFPTGTMSPTVISKSDEISTLMFSQPLATTSPEYGINNSVSQTVTSVSDKQELFILNNTEKIIDIINENETSTSFGDLSTGFPELSNHSLDNDNPKEDSPLKANDTDAITFLPEADNSTWTEDYVNSTVYDISTLTNIGNISSFEGLYFNNGTLNSTVNATTGIKCREGQSLCEELNKCLNKTFVCDGIKDCPNGSDEIDCEQTCHDNFRCANSSKCITSEARCDGIWDCDNGTDEENCTPTECAKHEVMCLDGSTCIKPGDICDWKYNCRDRSDEVGCVERTTCETGGRFFCNDGLCIPWSLKCDGNFDCKDKEDEGNCTCLEDEFKCYDGKCLKSSSRCDGHQDCHNAEDEMGCVKVDDQGVVHSFEPYSGSWSLLCADDWTQEDGRYLCQELGFGHVLSVTQNHVSFNGTWMTMKRQNLTSRSLWTERVGFSESCSSNLAAVVSCQKFECGKYAGLLHRRRRQASSLSSPASQWPFIAYVSTFQSLKGCLSEILTPIWLVTSAECLLSIGKQPHNGSDWYVRTNVAKGLDSDLAQNHEVLKIILHPHSSMFRSLTLRDYDVALIRLKYALVFSDKIGAICLPEEEVPSGITCFSGVLGTENPRAPPPQSLSISSLALVVNGRDHCNLPKHYNEQVNQRMLCTKASDGPTICDNDEGTPLMCLSGPSNWYLAGMLTYQRFCGVYNKHPAVFSNLFAMRNFIDQVTGQKQYDTLYDNSIYVTLPPTTPGPSEVMTKTSTIEEATSLPNETELSTEEYNITSIPSTNATVDIYVLTGDIQNLTEFETQPSSNIDEDHQSYHASNTSDTTANDLHTINIFEVPTTSPISTVFSERLSSDVMNVQMDKSFMPHVTNLTDDSNFTSTTGVHLADGNIKPEVLNGTHESLALRAGEEFDSKFYENDSTAQTSAVDSHFTTVDLLINSSSATHTTEEPLPEVLLTPINKSSKKHNNLSVSDLSSFGILEPPFYATTPTTDVPLTDNDEYFSPSSTTNDEHVLPTTAQEVNDTEIFSGSLHTNVSSNDSVVLINNFEIPSTDSITTFINSSVDFDLSKPSEVESSALPESRNLSLSQIKSNSSSDVNGRLPEIYNSSSLQVEIDRSSLKNISKAPHNESNVAGFGFATMKSVSENFNMSMIPLNDLIDSSYSISAVNETSESPFLIFDNNYNENSSSVEKNNYDGDELNEKLSKLKKISEDIQNIDIYQPLVTTNLTSDFDEHNLSEKNYKSDEELITVSFQHENASSANDSVEFSTANGMPLLLETAHNDTFSETLVLDSFNDNANTLKKLKGSTFNSSFTLPIDLITSNDMSSFGVRTTDSPVTTILEIKPLVNATESMSIVNKTGLISDIPFVNISETYVHHSILENGNKSGRALNFEDEESFYFGNYSCGEWEVTNDEELKPNSKHDIFEQWPFLGIFQMVSENNMCAASIVSPHVVLAPLDCLLSGDYYLDPRNWVFSGSLSGSFNEQYQIVKEIIPNPFVSSENSAFAENRLAVGILRDSLNLSLPTKVICLPQQPLMPNQTCFTSGWSKDGSGNQSSEFSSFPVSIVPPVQCNSSDIFNGTLPASSICITSALETSESLCQMDIGAPLICLNSRNKWEIHGLLTTSRICDEKQIVLYSDIQNMKYLIADIVRSIESDSMLL